MSVPRVSVVIPTFQNVAFVEETVRSVLAQTFTDFELVVADHASSDGTWDVLQQLTSDDRVRLLRTDAGGGAARNWNRVTDAAEADLLKLVCADDLLYPTCLAEQVAALDGAPSAAMVACRRDIIDARGRVVLRGRGVSPMVGLVRGPDAVRRAVRAGTNLFGEPACVMLRRQALVSAGGWEASYPFLTDLGTYAKVLAHGDLVAQREVLAAFRLSAQQWSVALVREQAGQAAAFHRSLLEAGDAVVPADVRIGNARALAMAFGRRIAYRWLGSRMRPAPR